MRKSEQKGNNWEKNGKIWEKMEKISEKWKQSQKIGKNPKIKWENLNKMEKTEKKMRKSQKNNEKYLIAALPLNFTKNPSIKFNNPLNNSSLTIQIILQIFYHLQSKILWKLFQLIHSKFKHDWLNSMILIIFSVSRNFLPLQPFKCRIIHYHPSLSPRPHERKSVFSWKKSLDFPPPKIKEKF